jgi:hypothetical protein
MPCPKLALRAVEHHADEQRLELHGDLGERGRVLAMCAPAQISETLEIDRIRRYRNVRHARSASLDHDQLSAERPGFAQRLEYRHQIARRRTDLVNGLDDVVQARARLEHEHPAVALIDVDAD